jgi:hypothetical protein
MNNLNKIMNSCSKKQKCSICYENKYINYKCNQCLEGMICYDCSFQFIENGYNNKCPICNLETNDETTWHKQHTNLTIIVPKKEVFHERIDINEPNNDCIISEIMIMILFYIKNLIFIISCILVNYAMGLFMICMFSIISLNELNNNILFIIFIPTFCGLLFWTIVFIIIKCCCFKIVNSD